ncbi:MAG: hypothetical protein UY12_C0019G0006 [Parcubacteria group bacterium GW2011_GWA2_47_8b]|uniref:DUF5667 domain-containing protein n=1 Tax=Candidatus Harrisonbacteria bacterium RIFCSPHIGHO2_12_FULL_48_16 TaxID=1798405 RepID=A0A1G1ZHW1_9BACT|nr:MAG: hypothetical protein UY12_C0019G0006 [Parcubacteria group bacterium GW2011_GWA2_47_8b]OGY64173.1 MAG: hypothetical protein A3E64_00405 [Candidatus Harrisonbacteria bacterium RIFCSPHIGHO2_12_FULL_48_16]
MLKIIGALLVFVSLFAISPRVSAQSEALKSALREVSASVNNESGDKALKKVINFLSLQIDDLTKSLNAIKSISAEQEAIRQDFLDFLNESAKYLDGLVVGSGSDIKALANEINNWRENAYNQRVNKITEFLMVLQTKSLLKTADTRLVKIGSDLARLRDLKILKDDKAQFLFNESNILLVAAGDLTNQAELQLSTTTIIMDERKPGVRDLVFKALTKIQQAYKRFIEISGIILPRP